MKKKILFIITSYPSEMSANVLCDDKIIQALLKDPLYDVHILALRFNRQPEEEIINGAKVYRFSTGLFWDMYTKARHSKASWKTKIIFALDRFFLRLKQVLFLPLYPVYQPWEMLLFYLHAKRLHKKENFDLVIAEHNGLDTLMGGYLLKKKFPAIKFVPVFWDALSGAIAPKYLPYEYSQKKRIETEKKVFEKADRIIIMQDKQSLNKIYKDNKISDKILSLGLPSLQNPEDIQLIHTQRYTFVPDITYLCFAGTLIGRDLEFIVKLLDKSKLKNTVLLAVSSVESQTYVENLGKKYNFPVHFLPYMPHGELMDLLGKVNIFINLGVNSNTMVASKIFEYMGFGKPLIHSYIINDDANLPYLKKYPLSFLADGQNKDLETQAKQLRNFIEQNADKHISYEQVEPLFYNNTARAYVEEIAKLLKGK